MLSSALLQCTATGLIAACPDLCLVLAVNPAGTRTLCAVCKLLIHLASTLSQALLDEHAGEIDHLARTRQLLWSSQSMNIPFTFHSNFLLLILCTLVPLYVITVHVPSSFVDVFCVLKTNSLD